MYPVVTETMIHLKPVCQNTWSYHGVKAWYFAPSLKHYRIIKNTNEEGAVPKTDTRKYNHHSIKTPTVTPVEKIIKATKNLTTAIYCHNNAPQDELEAIDHLQALITGNDAPTSRQSTEQQVDPLMQRHLEPEHISELTEPVGDFDPPAFVPQPTTVNDNAHAPEVISHKEDEEAHVQHRYNLRTRPNIVIATVYPVHIQHPRVHPSVTSATISPNITFLKSRVAVVNYKTDPSIIPIIKVKSPQRKYAQGYDAANHALQLWQL